MFTKLKTNGWLPRVSPFASQCGVLSSLPSFLHTCSSLSSLFICRFLYAYQYLEQIGKLRLARFSNTHDIVPLIPFHYIDGLKIGRPYKHVGMHVRLFSTSAIEQHWLRKAFDETKAKHHDLRSQIKRDFWSNIFINLN
jgi:hypothetical protein